MRSNWIELTKVAAVLIAAVGLFSTTWDGIQTRQLTKRLHAYQNSIGWDHGEVLAARTALKVTFEALQNKKLEKALTPKQAESLFAARNSPGSADYTTYNQVVAVLNYFEDMCISWELDAIDKDYIRKAFGNTIPQYEEYFREFIAVYADSSQFDMWGSLGSVAKELRDSMREDSST